MNIQIVLRQGEMLTPFLVFEGGIIHLATENKTWIKPWVTPRISVWLQGLDPGVTVTDFGWYQERTGKWFGWHRPGVIGKKGEFLYGVGLGPWETI